MLKTIWRAAPGRQELPGTDDDSGRWFSPPPARGNAPFIFEIDSLNVGGKMERATGLEPATPSLGSLYSTS